jgi:ADP-heptose:LPS heptosyltransferase
MIPENKRSAGLSWYYRNREKVCAKSRASYKPKPRKKSKYGTFANTKEYYAAYRAANRERYNAALRKHYWKNLEASRAYACKMAKNWRDNNPDEAKKRNEEQRSKLSDSYVARCIMGIPTRQCPRDVIELVREHVKLRRELRKKPNDQTN